jgi:hypothetical protein
MLYQAFVANFSYGVYVVAMSYGVYVVAMSDDVVGGRILQIVITSIPPSAITLHRAKIIAVTKPVLGWLYNDKIIERGYLTDEDFSSWVFGSNESTKESIDLKAILMSWCKLWYAIYKKLKGDRSGPRCFVSMPPLNLFKLASRFVYNKGKGGLDSKGTEQEARFRPPVKVSFESKYILCE